jgi:3,4-dihydroxy 2-butanone 4-phosphate synthase
MDLRENLLEGLPVLVYDFDGREEEVDMVFYAGKVSWLTIFRLRTEAGGLICYVTGSQETRKLSLEFSTDTYMNFENLKRLVKPPKYKDLPAFTVWVNHVDVKTGISDEDRALTIRELHKVVEMISEDEEKAREYFYSNFLAPGHVPILASRGLDKRKGHTELVVSLAEQLELKRSMVIAEMLGRGKSLKREQAIEVARRMEIPFIEGKQIIAGVAK